MTSLLRDAMPVPIAAAASATITSWPAKAAARDCQSHHPGPTTSTCIPCPASIAADCSSQLRRTDFHFDTAAYPCRISGRPRQRKSPRRATDSAG